MIGGIVVQFHGCAATVKPDYPIAYYTFEQGASFLHAFSTEKAFLIGEKTMGTYQKEIYKLSYDVLKNEFAQDNPGISGHDLSVLTAQKFRPRFRLDEQSRHHEIDRTEKYVIEDVELTSDGDIYYPQYDRTAEKLNENTRLHNPELYSHADHQASRLAAKTLAGGASIVAASYARPGNDNRDIQIFKIDPVTKRGISLTINAAIDGRLHTVLEMQAIMQGIFPELTRVQPQENISIFTDKPISKENARYIVFSVNPNYQQPVTEWARKNHNDRQGIMIDRRNYRWIYDAAPIDSKIERTTPHHVKQTKHGSSVAEESKTVFFPFRRQSVDVEKKNSIGAKRRDFKGVFREGAIFSRQEKPIRVLPMIQGRHKEMIRAKKALVAVRETGIGVGAIPFLLSIMAKELPKPVRQIEKRIRRHKKKELRMENRELRLKKQEKPAEQPRRRRSGERRVVKVVNRKAIAEKLTLFISEKARISKRIRRELRAFHRKEKKSLEKREKKIKLICDSKSSERRGRRHKTTRLASQGESLRSGEKRAIAGLTQRVEGSIDRLSAVRVQFAWKLWLLLCRHRGISKKDFNKFPTGKILKHSVSPRIELLPKMELTPWILLSIIWYLATIREAGTQPTNQQISPVVLPVFPMYQQGVIFAFGS